MNFDVRMPVGWMFTLTGLLLSFLGWSTRNNAALYVQCQGIDANLWWGLALLAFGLAMMLYGKRAQPGTGSRDQGPGNRQKARRTKVNRSASPINAGSSLVST
jgi:hypothetical protein